MMNLNKYSITFLFFLLPLIIITGCRDKNSNIDFITPTVPPVNTNIGVEFQDTPEIEVQKTLTPYKQHKGNTEILVSQNITSIKYTYTFVTKWGSDGYDNNQFKGPGGIAIDSNGNVYVMDCYYIRKFDSSGNFLKKWKNPDWGYRDIAINSEGNLYIADSVHNQIQIFDGNVKFIENWGSTDRGDDDYMDDPPGIGMDMEGNIYVTGSLPIVKKFDKNRKFLKEYSCDDYYHQMLTDIAIDSSGNIYALGIVEEEDMSFIYKFEKDDLTVWKFWDYFGGIIIDSQGNLLVSDMTKDEVLIYDCNMNLLAKFGGKGDGDGQFVNPYRMAIDSKGNLYVVDCRNSRVQKFALKFKDI